MENDDYQCVMKDEETGDQDSLDNDFENFSWVLDAKSNIKSDDDGKDQEIECKKRSIVDFCFTDSCIAFKDLEKRVKLASIMSDCQKRDVEHEIIVISSDEDEIIVISSDEDEELVSASSDFVTDVLEGSSFLSSEEDIDNSNSVELNKDSNMNFNESSIHWFFSPKKQKITESPPKVKNDSTANEKLKEKKYYGPAAKVEEYPITKSFFKNKTFVVTSEWWEKVGVSAPFCAFLKCKESFSSMKPREFSTTQTDFIDGLGDDVLFFGAYIDTVLSHASTSVSPPGHVVMYIFSKVAQSTCRTISMKAVNCLRRLLSMKLLTYRNFHLTWDTLNELAVNILKGLKTLNGSENADHSKQRGWTCLQLFLFVVSFLEEDFKRFHDAMRCCILRKIFSPCLHGWARLRKVAEWSSEVLCMLESAEVMHNSKHDSLLIAGSFVQPDDAGQCYNSSVTDETVVNRPNSEQLTTKYGLLRNEEDSFANMAMNWGKEMIHALQRLFHLIFLLNRNAKEDTKVIAEAFVDCFLQLKTLKWRKTLLSTIEPSLLQQTTAELLLLTIFDDIPQSAEYVESGKMSLETIVYGYFYQKLPFDNNVATRDENIELFTYLLWLFLRSYLSMRNIKACQKIRSLSVLGEYYEEICKNCSEEMKCLSDRETLLSVSQEICLLRDRLLRYRGCERLSRDSELYLKLMSTLLECNKDFP